MIATTSTHNHHSSFAMKRSTDDLGGSESNSERLNKRNKQGNTTGFTRQGGEELFEEQKQQRSPFLSSSSGDPQTLQEGRAFGGIPSSNLYSGSQVQMMMNQQQLLQGQQQLNPTSPQGVQLLLNELNRTQQQEAAASTLLAQARMNSANAAAAADNIFLQQAMGNQQQQQQLGYPNLASTARMNPYAASSNFPGTSVMGQSSEQQTGGIDPFTMAALAQMNRLGGTGGGGGGGGQDDLLLGQQPPSLSIQNLLQRQGAAHAAAAPQDPYVALLMQSMATGGGGGASNAAALMGGGQQHAGLQARTQFQLPSDQLGPSIPRMSASDNFGAASAATTSALSAPAPSAGAASAKTSSSKDGVPLSLPSDANNLSEYQCLLRAQIDLFAATDADIEGNAQGRNKPIVRHQVGIRCRHCHMNPSPSRRSRGAVYFPAKLSGLYQAAQNMAINHFTESCRNLDEETREQLAKLKERKSYKLGGGKGYWATGARIRNVIEVDSRLFFEDSKPSATSDSASASAGPKKKSKK